MERPRKKKLFNDLDDITGVYIFNMESVVVDVDDILITTMMTFSGQKDK